MAEVKLDLLSTEDPAGDAGRPDEGTAPWVHWAHMDFVDLTRGSRSPVLRRSLRSLPFFKSGWLVGWRPSVVLAKDLGSGVVGLWHPFRHDGTLPYFLLMGMLRCLIKKQLTACLRLHPACRSHEVELWGFPTPSTQEKQT